MKKFWLILNSILFLLFVVSAGVMAYFARPYLLDASSTGPVEKAEAAAPAETVELPNSIQFNLKGNSIYQEEAILVEAENPFRFTLRPVFDVPSSAPDAIRSYVATYPNLEERTQIEWKTEGGGTIQSPGEGRYEFTPPPKGGDAVLTFRATLQITTNKGVSAVLQGQKELRFVCPVRWDDIPPKVQDMIGRYPVAKEYKNFYKRPPYWYQVTADNENWKISPHFKLGDFDLHFDYTTAQSPELNQFTQYIALNPNLVRKLEEILNGLQEKGIQVDTLGILAGFRSPGYNHWKKEQGGVGGKYTKGLSTHMYGAAADFYVDRDGDGIMDDLNGDGVSDQKDAAWIRDEVVDAIDCQAQEANPGMAGACGIYGEHDVPDRSPQTPNVHVDVRKYALTRWYINSHDKMITDWSHWDKKPCPKAAGQAKEQASSKAAEDNGTHDPGE